LLEEYHRVEVLDPVDGRRVLGDFLVEAVADVVSRVRGYDQDLPALLGNESGQAAACGGFSDSALAAYKDPAERLLVEDVLEGPFHLHFHVGKYQNNPVWIDIQL
jgi:hypothetical protein